jgi:hypothetical protein
MTAQPNTAAPALDELTITIVVGSRYVLSAS